MENIKEKIKQVNKILLEGEPDNVSKDTYSGFDKTGYKPQFVVDAMNEVFSVEGWNFEETKNEVKYARNKDGEEKACFVSRVKVIIGGAERSAWGGNVLRGTNIGDAKKSAQTDALKKALSYFGVGNRAFRGEIGDDVEEKAKKEKANENYGMATKQRGYIFKLGEDLDWDSDKTKKHVKNACGVDSFRDITVNQASKIIEILEDRRDKKQMEEAEQEFNEDVESDTIPF